MFLKNQIQIIGFGFDGAYRVMRNIIIDKARVRFDEFINKYQNSFPEYVKARYTKKPNYLISYLQMLFLLMAGLIYAIIVKLKPERTLYFFEGGRFTELHSLFPSEQVVIIGGVRELRYCRANGYKFHWDGYIRKLFNIFYYLKIDFSFQLLTFLVRSLIGTQLGSKGRIFLFEDTVQIGAALALILKEASPVICVIHGSMSKPVAECSMSVDGEISCYNLVYDDYQKNILEGLGVTSYVMGLTHEVSKLVGWSNQIILIEQSTPDMPTEYLESLSKMEILYKILVKYGYEVVYRSRPGVSLDSISDIFHSVHVGDKRELLDGHKKIFIGFNSTLLYEAKFHGHVTIGLDDTGFPLMRRFDTDFLIEELSESCIINVVERALLAVRDGCHVSYKPLKERFMSALTLIEQDIKRQSNWR